MNFPSSLIQKGRGTLPNNPIFLFHRVYIRHKPGHGWNIKDDLPDFTTIKIPDQSCNWSQFSIPIWARFNDQKAYNKEYAVVTYKLGTIRKIGSVLRQTDPSSTLDDNTLDVVHDPIENNYSHCVLKQRVNLNPTQRRAVRMAMKHKSSVYIKPDLEKETLILKLEYFVMLLRQYTCKLLFKVSGGILSGLK